MPVMRRCLARMSVCVKENACPTCSDPDTVSGGVSVSVKAEQTLDALLEYSDVALYGAKTEGRNRIKRAEPPKPEGGLSNVFRIA